MYRENFAMTRCLPRRKILQGVLGGMAAYALAPDLRAASAAPATALAGNISLLNIGGVNVVVALTETEVVFVDTGPAENTPDLIEQLQAMSASTKYTLFNTHWHSDQTGGNYAFGILDMGNKIFAHKKTQLHLSTEVYLPSEGRYRKPVRGATDSMFTFYTTGTYSLRNETIDYGYLLQAHTDGDIYVYFRNANVLAVGDVVSPERDPELDWYGGGWLGGRVDAMDLLLELCNDTTQIVPSYGPVVSKAQLQLERDMMAFLYEKLVEQVRMGFTAKDSFDSGVMSGLPRTFNDPQKFLYDAHKGLWAHHNKLAPNVV
jgi:glyoxylase-like metal-dependent hydrolase (beta-lactamase superfamily II)